MEADVDNENLGSQAPLNNANKICIKKKEKKTQLCKKQKQEQNSAS